MATDFKKIEKSALNLDQKNKVRLVEKLLESMRAQIDPEIEQSWIKEVNKRKESLKSGKASLHSSEEVIREARKLLQK
ncbi:MAG: addiction module protein [Balneolaceae bacterium]